MIPEYQSANFHLPETWPFIIILLMIVVGFARSTAKASWTDILLVSAFAGLALYTSRMIPLFAIVAVPIAARVTSEWIRKEYSQSKFLTIEENLSKTNLTANGFIWFLAIPLLLAGLLRSGQTIGSLGQGNVFDSRFFPVEAVSWLETHPQEGHMFNEFDWGGYLLLKLWPSQQIFMDGHTHIYGETLTREYGQVIDLGTGWESILKKYDVHWVIMRRNAPLAQELSASEDWKITYQDQTAIILVKK